MSLKTYNYDCPDCGVFGHLVPFEERDAPQSCPDCGAASERTWAGAVPNVPRASYVDGTKRFDGIRTTQRLKRARSAAKETGDRLLEKEIRTEIKRKGRE